MKSEFKFQATVAAGLESLVARELRQLDFQNVRLDDRSRVFFDGDLADLAKANLWLRVADKVKIVVGEFQARSFEDLFDQVFSLDWEDYLPLGAAFPVAKAKSVKSQLHHEPTVQAITKKAIAKKLQSVYHRPDHLPLPEEGASFKIEISIHKDDVTVTIDTTGESLFKRGYRKDHGGAPIKENMAAAIILLTNYLANPARSFVDPTCGSGTFCIEAAMLALNMAPGMNRRFACEKWPWLPEEIFDLARKQAKAAVRSELMDQLDVQGFDIDPRMVELAHANTLAAGLGNVVKYKQMRLQDFRPQTSDGVLVSNPPYGERLGSGEAAQLLYAEMRETFRPLESWSKYILTSDQTFETYYGERATKKRKLYNGTLRTDLYQYFGKRL